LSFARLSFSNLRTVARPPGPNRILSSRRRQPTTTLEEMMWKAALLAVASAALTVPGSAWACGQTCNVLGTVYQCDILGDRNGCSGACDECPRVCIGGSKNGQNCSSSIDRPGGSCPAGGDGKCVICGTDGGETIQGTPGDDIICGKGGNDTIFGNGGNEIPAGRGRHSNNIRH